MPDIKARISQSGMLKGSANSQNEIVASKVEVNTAGINLGDLTDVTITSPTDGSFIKYQNSSNSFTTSDASDVFPGAVVTALTTSMLGGLTMSALGSTTGAAIIFREGTANGTNGIKLQAPAQVDSSSGFGTLDITFPNAAGTMALTSDIPGTTLTQAAQTNITSLGTLTALTVDNVKIDGTTIGHTSDTDLITLASGQVTVAGTLTATTLSGDLATSNLTGNMPNARIVSGNVTQHQGSLSIATSQLTGDMPNARIIVSNVTQHQGSLSIASSQLTGDMPNARIVVGNVTQHQSSLSVATTQLTGTITNTQLAGSITNDKLSNSTVNFGGVSVALGASNTTPAFDLQHATNLPTSALTGDMPNARIIASNITQHQAALSVATSQLSGSITNAQLANSSITVSDGSNTSPVALGGTLSFTGTSNEVTVAENAGTVTIGLPDDVTLGGDLVVTGDLTVNGTETILNSTTLSVDDKNIVLGSVTTPTDTTADGGGITLKGVTDKTLNWVNSTDSWTSSEHFEVASAKTFRINGNEVLSQTTLGSTVLASSLTIVGALDSGSITSNFSDIDIGDNVVTAAEFVGDLRGAVRFQAKAGESLAKGDVVYISSVSGQKPVVSKAQANSAATMPSFGLANAAVSANGNIEVISFGTFAHGDTTGGAEEWEFGDILYVSAATAGALTNVKPAGAANLIQNVGKVERVHASTGSIMVAGAGRTAATPNLDTGKFFIGDSNNYSTTGSFNNQFTNTSGTISLNGANITTVGTIGTGTWQGTAIVDTYISSASTWNDKQDALTFGKASGNTLKSEEALVTNDVLLMGSANVKGRTYSEFKTDISLNNVENTAISTFAGTTNITTVGTIGTGTWQGTAIANDYIGDHSAAKLTSGTIPNARLPSAATNITSVGSLTNLIIQPPSGSTGGILVNSRGGNATFILDGVGSVGDADYVAKGNFSVLDAANTVISSDAISLVGPTAVNGALTVNSDLLKVVSTDDGAVENPILSLYRNSSSIAVTDEIGAIEFSGNDANGEEHIYGRIYSEISVIGDGAEQANLRFAVSRSGGMEDPTMVLRQYGLELMPGNNLYLQGSNHLEYKGQSIVGDASSPYDTKLTITNPTADRTISLPDAAGTIALTDSATAFTAGATTVNGALTVNSDLLEITSTVDDATEKPIISLYRDAGVPGANDELGAIRWFGQNTSDEKQFYGGIYAQADVITDGAHKGSLNFHLADGSNNGTAISDVLVDINGDEDPTMNLTSELLTLNAGLIVNNDSMEIVSTEAGADAMPIISLFKNGGSTTDNDDLGGIRFYGMNDHSTPKKTFYAGMYGELGRGDHGDEIGRIKWHLADGSGTEDAVTDVTATITGDSDPTMTLEYFALNLKNDVNINFQAGGGTSYVAWDTGSNHTKLSADMTQDAAIVCTLPTVSGTLVAADDAGAITASQTISIVTDTSIDVTEFATYNGKKIIYTGGTGTVILADAVTADIGKSWTIINAGTGAITIDRTTSTQTIKLLNGSSVSAGSANLTIATGGAIEIICTAADNYIAFGSGVS